jgi:competence protein ComEA
MERPIAPWRVLDADSDRAIAGTGQVGAMDRRSTTTIASWPVVGGLLLAGVIVVAAFAVVATGPAPVAIVQTDAAPVSVAEPGTSTLVATPLATVEAVEIIVHVAGAVARPGIVRLASGARVADAIDAAGGLSPRVDATRLGRDMNLAATLADGDQVIVPSRDDPTAPAATVGGPARTPSEEVGELVDINTATASALEELPGIGPVTAEKIIAARAEQPFATLDELVERKVVGAATLEKFRDRAVVR